jgi:hypothetical protein
VGNDRQFCPTTNMGACSAYPTLRKEREGWGTRTLDVVEKKDRALMGFARLYQPTYAGANMGHPFRVGVSGIVDYQDTCSELV